MSQIRRLFGDDIIVSRMFLKTRQNMHPGRAHAHTQHRGDKLTVRWEASQKHLMLWRAQSASISNGHLIYFSKNDVSLLSQTLLSVLIQDPVHYISTPSRPCPVESLAATCPHSQPTCHPSYPRGQMPNLRQSHPACRSHSRALVQPHGSPQTCGSPQASPQKFLPASEKGHNPKVEGVKLVHFIFSHCYISCF